MYDAKRYCLKKRLRLITTTALILGIIFPFQVIHSMKSSFKLEPYQGKWYEIARFKNPFQKKCLKNVTAEYQLLENGMIEVTNQCEEKNGKIDSIKGLARIQDQNNPSKLEVSFFDIFGWRPIWGDYWVLYIDSNYSWSVVGDRKSQYGWILSRTPALAASNLKKAKLILDENGYDSTKLLMTTHDHKR